MWMRIPYSGVRIFLHQRRLQFLVLVATLLVMVWYRWPPVAWLVYPSPDKRSLVPELRRSCELALSGTELSGDVLKSLRWVCGRVGAAAASATVSSGCGKTIMFQSAGWLRHFMSQYAIVFCLAHLHGARGVVAQDAWTALHPIFPHLSLLPESVLSDPRWVDISLKEVEAALHCSPRNARNSSQQFYRIIAHPETSGLDLFQVFEDQIRREFTPSNELVRQSEDFLVQAAGFERGKTFVSVYVGMDWSGDLLQMDEHIRSAEVDFIRRHMNDVRRRLNNNTVFVVFSEDLSDHALARWQLGSEEDSSDVVLVPSDVSKNTASRIALMSACNRSIVMGTEAFWGAYLAKGSVISPTWRRDDVSGHRDGIKLDFRHRRKMS